MTINLLFVQIVPLFLKTKMISLWCNHHYEKNGRKKSVNLQQNAELLHSYLKEKGPPVWRDPSATSEQDVSENSSERSDEVLILYKKSRL